MTKLYNLIVPMAGMGSRFLSAGYEIPKPLLPIGPFRMFEVVIANLMSIHVNEISLVAPKAFQLEKDCSALQRKLQVPIHLVEVDEVTDGPASSALLGLEPLEEDLPLVIANSDQYLDFEMSSWISNAIDSKCSGSILCMQDDSPKWSYIELNDKGLVVRVVEKEVTSRFATCGVYFFGAGSEFRFAARCQETLGEMVNGEFYVGPVYNHLISLGKRIDFLDIGPVNEVMFGLGTPEDYESFITGEKYESAIEKSRIWIY